MGELTYIQLTESIETGAATPVAGERRRRLEDLMAPILVGAPVQAVNARVARVAIRPPAGVSPAARRRTWAA
ncbi:MAG: hypothetical protein HS111_25135 [Kofleriaceae bacterium]|nr:hypothetical protein [Kofleriaceae bacterium]